MMDYATLAQAQSPAGLGNLATAQPEPELSSLLTTIAVQASDIRKLADTLYGRVCSRLEDESADQQCFSGGHIGRAEEIRFTQRAALNVLSELAKFV